MTNMKLGLAALRNLIVGGGMVLLSITGSPTPAQAAPEDVTASVHDGVLTIKRASGSTDGFFFVGITLEGRLEEDIRVYVGNDLLGTYSRSGDAGVTAIAIDGDQSLVSFGRNSPLEFEGDINVDVHTGGACFLERLNMLGNLHLRGSAGAIRVEYSFATIDGNLTLDGGPGADSLGGDPFFGFLAISGTLAIDGGPGNEYISLANLYVGGDTLINLGQSSGGEPASSADKDFLRFDDSVLSGSLMISGDEGDDDLEIFFSSIGGNLFVDMGNGADLIEFFGSSLAGDSQVLLDGGNGNSDELYLNGFPLLADEYKNFEIVKP